MNIDLKIQNLESQLLQLKDKKELLIKRSVDIESLLSEVKKRIGFKLRLVRTQKKLSKTTLAELSGVSRMTIHRAEIGESLLGIDSIVRLCIALQCEFDDIVLLKSCSSGGKSEA